jgi:uncharacterized OsmC-like protein
MMTLAYCGVTIFADVCKRSNIELNKVEVTVEAEKSPDSPAVMGVTMKVTVSLKARKELLDAAWRRTEANCPVLFIFNEPTSVKVEFEGKPITKGRMGDIRGKPTLEDLQKIKEETNHMASML